jgi:hypothetical protein
MRYDERDRADIRAEAAADRYLPPRVRIRASDVMYYAYGREGRVRETEGIRASISRDA